MRKRTKPIRIPAADLCRRRGLPPDQVWRQAREVIAGGTDLLYQMKNQIELLTPQYVVDITELGLDGVSFSPSSRA